MTHHSFAMRRVGVPLCLAVACIAGAALAAEDSVSGTWKLTTSFGSRSRAAIVKLHEADGKIKGQMLHYQGARSPIEGRVEGDQVVFEVSQTRRGETYRTEYRGTLQDGEISGTSQYRWRGRSRDVEWTAKRTFDTPLSPDPVVAPPVEADIDLTEANYAAWRDHILPAESEMSWSQIPWHPTLKDGILAANAAEKPLLLWTMNGHPLGCT